MRPPWEPHLLGFGLSEVGSWAPHCCRPPRDWATSALAPKLPTEDHERDPLPSGQALCWPRSSGRRAGAVPTAATGTSGPLPDTVASSEAQRAPDRWVMSASFVMGPQAAGTPRAPPCPERLCTSDDGAWGLPGFAADRASGLVDSWVLVSNEPRLSSEQYASAQASHRSSLPETSSKPPGKQGSLTGAGSGPPHSTASLPPFAKGTCLAFCELRTPQQEDLPVPTERAAPTSLPAAPQPFIWPPWRKSLLMKGDHSSPWGGDRMGWEQSREGNRGGGQAGRRAGGLGPWPPARGCQEPAYVKPGETACCCCCSRQSQDGQGHRSAGE